MRARSPVVSPCAQTQREPVSRVGVDVCRVAAQRRSVPADVVSHPCRPTPARRRKDESMKRTSTSHARATRRTAGSTWAAWLTVAALAMAACSDDGDDTVAPESPDATEAADTTDATDAPDAADATDATTADAPAAGGGSFSVAISEPASIDPALSQEVEGAQVTRLLFTTLTTLTPGLELAAGSRNRVVRCRRRAHLDLRARSRRHVLRRHRSRCRRLRVRDRPLGRSRPGRAGAATRATRSRGGPTWSRPRPRAPSATSRWRA